MLLSHWKDRSSLIFQILKSKKYYLIFFNQHRNENYLHQKKIQKSSSKSLLHESWSTIISSLQPLTILFVILDSSSKFKLFLLLLIFDNLAMSHLTLYNKWQSRLLKGHPILSIKIIYIGCIGFLGCISYIDCIACNAFYGYTDCIGCISSTGCIMSIGYIGYITYINCSDRIGFISFINWLGCIGCFFIFFILCIGSIRWFVRISCNICIGCVGCIGCIRWICSIGCFCLL